MYIFFYLTNGSIPIRHNNRLLVLQQQVSQKASDDLLQLAGNPFANMFGAPQPAAPGAQSATQNNMWMSNGTGEHSI